MALLFDSPKIQVFGKRHFAGLVRSYTMQTRGEIPAQWMAYDAMGSHGPGAYYGVSYGFDPATQKFDYLCGQEVGAGAAVISIEGAHARFVTKAHLSTMQAAWGEIHDHWLGTLIGRPGPWVEYYPPEFDGRTGEGGYELWVPVSV